MSKLSPGKMRSLQATSTQDGIFKILAVDHRDSMRVLIDPDNPQRIAAATLTDLKLDIIRSIAPAASAVMLEPEYSAAQAIVSGALPGHVGFLCALEEQGYLGDPHARQTTLLEGWNVEKAKRLGANGIKLLVFYHPDEVEAAKRQESVIHAVIEACAAYEIALFLEPLFYSTDARIKTNSAEFAQQRQRIVVETARRLSALGPDVLKIQFPVDTTYESDEAVWQAACAELNAASSVPWAILSGGDPFDHFKAQLKVACQQGCSGFMVGRALWREVIAAAPDRRSSILTDTVLPRFAELAAIADTHGQSWVEKHGIPAIGEGWYVGY